MKGWMMVRTVGWMDGWMHADGWLEVDGISGLVNG